MPKTAPKRGGAATSKAPAPLINAKSGSPTISNAIASLDKFKEQAAKRGGVAVEKLAKLGAKAQAALSQGGGYQLLEIGKLGRSPWNRTHFSEEKLAELAESIKRHGILQNLIVRPNPRYKAAEESGVWRVRTIEGTAVGGAMGQKEAQELAYRHNQPQYEIVAGEHRWRAGKQASLKEVPVVVKMISDRDTIEIQAIENLKRVDLNPIEEAEKFQQLLDVYQSDGMSAGEAIAALEQSTGRSKSHIYESLRLLKLPDRIKEATTSRRLPPSHAKLLCKLVEDREIMDYAADRILDPDQDELPDEDEEPVETLIGQFTVMGYRATKKLVTECEEQIANKKAYNKLSAEYRAAGGKILTPEDNKAIYRHKHSSADGNTSYIDAGHYCQPEGRGRSWREALGKQAPELILSQNPYTYEPRELYDRQAALAAWKKKTGRTAKVSSRPESELKAERENRIRTQAFMQLLPSVAASAEHMDGSEIWPLLLREILHSGIADAMWRVTKRRWPEVKRDAMYHEFEKRTQDYNAKQTRGLVVELLTARHAPSQWVSGWGDGLEETCKLFGLQVPPWKVQTSGKSEDAE